MPGTDECCGTAGNSTAKSPSGGENFCHLPCAAAPCDRVMSFYKLQKDERGSHIWQPVSWSPDLARDLRWAVVVQVRGRAASDIAKEELRERQLRGECVDDMPASKVTRRVDKILRKIDLQKRGDYRVGRPKASHRKHPQH